MNSPVQQIKERISIEDLVSSYIKLEKAGKNRKAKCPFHNEKTPSFFISPERGSYYCFGCGAKGDIFTFVEEFEGLDFRGALRLLAERAGVPLLAYNPKAESEKEKLYRAMEEAAKFFENNLEKNKQAQKYLEQRGLKPETIKNFRLGYALPEWRALYEHFQGRFKDSDLETAGLIKKSEEGGERYYDRFRGRIMFSIADSSGRVIAFSGRIFPEIPIKVGIPTEVGTAKYLNSPETPIFNKSSVLYGLDRAKESIRKNNFSILVEGQMDLIMSHQAGFKNTIAASGTALSDSVFSKENVISNFGLIRRLSGNIVLAFDADRAGFAATLRAAKIALSLGMDVKIAEVTSATDPAELIREGGPDAWRAAIRKSSHIIEFLLARVLKEHPDSRKAAKEIKEQILPYVDAVESSIEKMYFVKRISEAAGIPERALEEDLRKIERDLKAEKQEITDSGESENKIYRKERILEKLLGILFWQKGLPNPALDAEKVLQDLNGILKVNIEERKGEMPDLIFEAEIFYGEAVHLEKEVKELLANLKEEVLREELARKTKELYLAEEKKNAAVSAKVLRECQAINKEIEEIKNNRFSNI
ncbi:DNA primase [Candidatus Nomurabacteria bacterium RIFCSPLOWO2_01_FULL_46_18]|uniref:DNA primase n=1 Tax=Candidatus Nomurabacteria bacterium RIFCSPLOWO2_01_FULL_46_18 TaxID=1801783 RepID=A0A1F6XDS4_9BACT|nr:MAG: DNA primase [Candidatus Nomurabacteria bacterium RIFCSPLOWO2_01_FULL_46_18]